MTNEPDLEDLLRDDIMAPVLRSAHMTPDDLRRQLAAVVRGASLGNGSRRLIRLTLDRAARIVALHEG